MVLKKKAWHERIRDISESEEYMTAIIRIVDRSAEAEDGDDTDGYDVKTNTWTEPTGDEIVYEGRARIISTRWGVDRNEDKLANPDTLLPVRVQVPRDELPGLVRKGSIVTVLEAPNEAIVGRILSVSMDFHGSSAASRTIQCRMSGDYVGD